MSKHYDFSKLSPAEIEKLKVYGLTKYTYDEIKPVYDAVMAVQEKANAMLEKYHGFVSVFGDDLWAGDHAYWPKSLTEMSFFVDREIQFSVLCNANTCESFPLSVWKKNAKNMEKAIKQASKFIPEIEWFVFMECN